MLTLHNSAGYLLLPAYVPYTHQSALSTGQPACLPSRLLQVLVDVLHWCLQHCVSTASVLRHRAAWLLPRALALALLSHSHSLLVNVRRQALGLLFQASSSGT